MDTMGLDGKFFITDTSFGNVVIENGYQDDSPISSAIEMAEDFELQDRINGANNAIRELQQKLDNHLKDFDQYNMIQLTDRGFHSVSAMLSGWQLNGNFFCRDKKNVNTVEELLVYYLTETQNDFTKLSRFHQLIVIELIEKYLPEKIIENTHKFESMKFNHTIKNAFA